jgi:protein dipZ
MLLSLIILGILGGLITGISPCILPILPVILVTGGADSARTASTEFGQTGIAKDSADNVQALFSRRSAVLGNAAPAPMQRTASRWRPYQVVGGLVLSFSLFTLLGSVILAALHLPQDTLRILGITFLIIVGLSMLIPPAGALA